MCYAVGWCEEYEHGPWAGSVQKGADEMRAALRSTLLPASVTSGYNSGQVAKVPFLWKLSYNLNLKKMQLRHMKLLFW